MKSLKYFITITQRDDRERYLEFFRQHGVNRVFNKMCNGVASWSTLKYLGLEDSSRIMFEMVVDEMQAYQIARDLYLKMDIGRAGAGMAVIVPMDGVGGVSALNYLVGEKQVSKEKSQMSDISANVLIITIVDKGNTDMVMDAARSAGATGGTVVKAGGTGTDIAKFFGISICDEKEMLYIVSSRKDRDNIMKAIMERAGSQTKAHGVVFSLPVEKVVGIRGLEEI